MRLIGTLSMLACLALAGCCQHCFCGKRTSEEHCPTDIRKTHFWCFGEDALFHYPCGPKEDFYGHEPTIWRSWPAEGSDWGGVQGGVMVEEMPHSVHELPSEEHVLPEPAEGSKQPSPVQMMPSTKSSRVTVPAAESNATPMLSAAHESAWPASEPDQIESRRLDERSRVELSLLAPQNGTLSRMQVQARRTNLTPQEKVKSAPVGEPVRSERQAKATRQLPLLEEEVPPVEMERRRRAALSPAMPRG